MKDKSMMHTIVGWYEDDDENPSNNEYDDRMMRFMK